mgnify:CR=1 FL=1
MGGCRGGAVYFGNSRGIEIAGIREWDFWGEGLSFQMCRGVKIIDCAFDENTGNGLHPGAGSTNVLFERCAGTGNGRSGFFFCVRANHITVRDCSFRDNALGTRDCYNLIENCRIEGNRGAGVLVGQTPKPTKCIPVGCKNARLKAMRESKGRGRWRLPVMRGI